MVATAPGGGSVQATVRGVPGGTGQTLGLGGPPSGFFPSTPQMTAIQVAHAAMSPHGPAYQLYGQSPSALPPAAAPLSSSGVPAAVTSAIPPPPPAGGPSPSQPAPTLNDYLTALLGGSAPTAPSASDFGPAPNLGAFQQPYQQAYQQALQAVTQGGKQATGTINGAYTQAANNINALQQAFSGQNAAFNNQLHGDQAQANSQLNDILGTAAKLGGGQDTVASLAPMRADYASSMEAQNALNNTLNQLQAAGNTAFKQGVVTNHQGALDALASALSGENGRLAQVNAGNMARAQADFNSANNSRATSMAKANTDYQTALKQYNAQRQGVLNAATGKETSNRDAALNTLAGWQQTGHPGLYSTANTLVNGKNHATNEAQAQQYLDQLYQTGTLQTPDGTAEPFGPDAYKALSGFIHQYYSPGKTGDLMGALQQMVGGS